MTDLDRKAVVAGSSATITGMEPKTVGVGWVLIRNQLREFLLGEDLLVAPVLEQGATSRDIYLPRGEWRDENTGKVYTGPTTLKKYPAPLEVLPYFERIKS
ncbi:unnamed protein product [Nezara viridula]|uniref:Glycosyl hydrolase family 31 C-terminal domain-containing protein n=1 Tax=Nezara viridula TaxID=85310 RepID=A0A9P0MHB6_NEZVI|nr:unnamed protein product [Nezara viridula]